MAPLSRRTFLKTAAVTGSLVGSARANSASASEHITTAVIGCRNQGWQLARLFHLSKRFKVAALCDCDSASFDTAMKQLEKVPPVDASPLAPRYEKDFRRVLDDASMDAVVIATPDHWHALIAVMALDAGKHVYLEKPFAFNIADSKSILAALERHPKLTLQVGTQHRSAAHIREAGEFLRSGGAGKVGFCRCWQTHNRPVLPKVDDTPPPATLDYDLWTGPAPLRPYNEKRVHYNWHFMKDYGTGDTGNWGAHWMDTARQILDLDLPTAVSGLGRKVIDDVKEWPDTSTILYDFPELTMIWELRLYSHCGVNNRFGGVEAVGTKGTVLVDRGGWWFTPNGDPKKVEVVAHRSSPMSEPHVANFADAIVGQARPNAPAIEGARSVTLCHLANIAAALNRRIEFDPRTLSIKGDPEAQAMQSREYRAPWKMPG